MRPKQTPFLFEIRIRQAVRFIAAGETIAEAARLIGVEPAVLYKDRRGNRAFWDAELKAAKGRVTTGGPDGEPVGPGEIANRIRRITALKAAGKTDHEIADELGITVGTIDWYRDGYRDLWADEFARAMEAAIVVVRRQAGTDAVLEDPDAFIRQALTCERWARREGRTIFSNANEPTLRTFYQQHYKSNRLSEARPSTIRSYETVVRCWALLTGDPPLKQITTETLARYRDCLKRMRGKDRVSRLSSQSIHRHLIHIQAILNNAGPPGYRNREAVGVIPQVPYIRRPHIEPGEPRFVTPEELNAVYLAAVAMHRPRLPGIKPPAWWRCLLVVTFNTGLRNRTLFEMRMEYIDWTEHCLVLPRGVMKAHRKTVKHLNATALAHLQKIRTDRELVFPWPFSQVTFYRDFHRLQDAAGIPRERHFGLHALRDTLATNLWTVSPQAAQLALDHRSDRVTKEYYVCRALITRPALDALPQPSAFVGEKELP